MKSEHVTHLYKFLQGLSISLRVNTKILHWPILPSTSLLLTPTALFLFTLLQPLQPVPHRPVPQSHGTCSCCKVGALSSPRPRGTLFHQKSTWLTPMLSSRLCSNRVGICRSNAYMPCFII